MDWLLKNKNDKDDDKKCCKENNKNPQKKPKKGKGRKGKKDLKETNREEASKHCGKWHASPDDKCWKIGKDNKSKNKQKGGKTMFSATQMKHVLAAMKKRVNTPKRPKDRSILGPLQPPKAMKVSHQNALKQQQIM